MSSLEPINQTKLYGLEKYFTELVNFYKNGYYPNKILFSGQKGIGKATLAFHFINYVLTINDEKKYDIESYQINSESPEFKTINNKSNTNLITIDVNEDKKSIDINQIRELIINLNKSSFNKKPRFVLIHNNRKILSTLLSRCINFKISLSNNDYLKISNQLLNNDLNNLVSNELINYYFTPGEIYRLVQFSSENSYDLSNIDLKNFLKILINDTQYKKNNFINNMMYSLMEFYFRKLNKSFSKLLNEKYSYFIKRISDTKTYNLDKESLFIEFNEEILDVY